MCSIYLLAHYLHSFLKYVDFSWTYSCQHKLFDFVVNLFFQMILMFSFTKSKANIQIWVTSFGDQSSSSSSSSFESLSLEPRQRNGVVYLTVLAPHSQYIGPYIISHVVYVDDTPWTGAWSTILMEVRFYGWIVIWQGCTRIWNSEKEFHAEKCWGSQLNDIQLGIE